MTKNGFRYFILWSGVEKGRRVFHTRTAQIDFVPVTIFVVERGACAEIGWLRNRDLTLVSRLDHAFWQERPSVMSSYDVALIKEQGVTFAVVSVKDHILHNTHESNKAVEAFSYEFGCPAVIMGARNHKLYGRRDLVNFLSRISISRLPWKRWNRAA